MEQQEPSRGSEALALEHTPEETNLSRAVFYLFFGFFLLAPLFFLPITGAPFQITKTIFILLAVFVILLLFIIDKLRNGSLPLPVYPTLLAAWAVPAAYLFSTLFASPRPMISLIGQRFETDTLFFIVANALLLTLVPIVIRSKQRILSFYSALLFSFLIIAVFQLLRLFLGAETLSLGVFTGSASNLVGKWNDLGIFFGLTAILALVTLEGLALHRFSKTILYAVLVISLFFLSVVDFTSVWVVLGLFTLGLTIYHFLRDRFLFPNPPSERDHAAHNSARNPVGQSAVSLSVLGVAVLFIIFGQSLSAPLNTYFGISQLEARPSWQSTLSITRQVYGESPVFGSGPNTFEKAWAQYKPQVVNNTPFWNVNFNLGIGFIPTSFATTGVLGALSWAAFLGVFVWSGVRWLLLRPVNDTFAYYLSLSTFIAALYLWIFAVIYVPSSVILSFSFFFTGLYLASLRHRGGEGLERTLVFAQKPRLGFVVVLALTVVIILAGSGIYTVGKRYLATLYFGKAVSALNIDGSETLAKELVGRAQDLTNIDAYARFSADLEVRRLVSVLSDSSVSDEERRAEFQAVLTRAIAEVQRARDLDTENFENWLALGRTYQSVVSLSIQGAYENARDAYNRALTLAPHNPEIYLALAELEVLRGDTTAAREHIGRALEEKRNYTAAVFLLAQIQINENEIPEAIQSVEAATLLEPANPVVYFQLGLLHYGQGEYENAARAFERAVALNDVYANARYFLGLSYYNLDRVEDAILEFKRVQETNLDNREVALIISNLAAGRPPLANLGASSEEPPIEGE